MESSNGTLAGLPVVLALETHGFGDWNGPVPGLFAPELQLDVLGNLFTIDTIPALSAQGHEYPFAIPSDPSTQGTVWRFQAFALHPSSPNGLFVSSAAVELYSRIGVRYYVDRINGSDTNDGLAPTAALASIERAIELKDQLAARCDFATVLIAGPGPYDARGLTISPRHHVDRWARRQHLVSSTRRSHRDRSLAVGAAAAEPRRSDAPAGT